MAAGGSCLRRMEEPSREADHDSSLESQSVAGFSESFRCRRARFCNGAGIWLRPVDGMSGCAGGPRSGAGTEPWRRNFLDSIFGKTTKDHRYNFHFRRGSKLRRPLRPGSCCSWTPMDAARSCCRTRSNGPSFVRPGTRAVIGRDGVSDPLGPPFRGRKFRYKLPKECGNLPPIHRRSPD